jgi:hypothetical protein
MAVGLPPSTVAANLEKWCEMADDAFDLMVEGFGALPSAPGDTIPVHTALHAGRETVAATASPVHELLELRQLGHKIDWSTLH